MPPTESWETKRTKAETAKFNLESKKLRLETERLDLELESMNRHKGWIDTESGESSDTLIYSFDFPVQGSTVRETIHFLTRWSRRWPGEKMTIIFNSPGGEVTEGLALFDFIQDVIDSVQAFKDCQFQAPGPRKFPPCDGAPIFLDPLNGFNEAVCYFDCVADESPFLFVLTTRRLD